MNNEEKDLDTRCPYHCSEKTGQCNNPSQETPHTYCVGNKDCIYKLYARKEQECEKAKQNAQDTYELYQALMESFNILQEEREKAKNYNLEYGQLLIKATNKNNKLKQALAEIKEIACDGYNNGQTSYATLQCEKIINIINEVNNEC